MTNYVKGRRAEYEIIDMVEAEGGVAVRSAGSHSPIDVFAIYPDRIIAIQSKAAPKLPANIYKTYEDDINALKELKVPPCMEKEIWVRVDRKGWTRYAI
jgi:Holliday junction resolvase